MEENPSAPVFDGEITAIRFSLANQHEISTASVSGFPISHAHQLGNPFLGLPLEFGKCESCGTAEPGECEGHFGYIELPIPIYHPSHVSELKKMINLICLECLNLKRNKFQTKSNGVSERLLSCCEVASLISIKECKTNEGSSYLQLTVPARSSKQDDCWYFLEKYGYRYGNGSTRNLLPCEVMEILKRISEDTKNKLARKGYFPQDGYTIQHLPVPPNCLSVPDISDGVSFMSSDHSVAMLKKVLKEIEVIKSSRSGTPNFKSHEVEANELQSAVEQYLQVRGTAKASQNIKGRFGTNTELSDSSTKAWLEKIRTLFIRKGSGFSSRSVITGDPYNGVNEIGLPLEIAQKITFEERVNVHNMQHLQELVDNKLCLAYSDGSSTYSLREGSKGHTFLRPGQVVHRRIMDGDVVFVNRPPTTHKHSLQALLVYIHEDHTVKINPVICGPLSADFDGDCVHIFYPQSLAAKAEVMELFLVEKQMLSSHTGNLNLQLATDSLLSLKTMLKMSFFDKAAAQHLAMFVPNPLPDPTSFKAKSRAPLWTSLQIWQTTLPSEFDCCGERYLIVNSEIVKIDHGRDVIASLLDEMVTSVLFCKGPKEVLKLFNSMQPLLMEYLFTQGFSIGLKDYYIHAGLLRDIQNDIQDLTSLLYHLRKMYDERVESRLENGLRANRTPVANFILNSSMLGYLIDSRSESAINKVVQQIGFLGQQLSGKSKFYSRVLEEDITLFFRRVYPSGEEYPSAEYGLVKSCFFNGLDPYEEMVHSISSREVIVRSSRGLSEPGTLFKNLMAILRDVAICYDGTVRNICTNSVIQFEYGAGAGRISKILFPAGEPVGILAATAMSNPAYKAVLDSTPNNTSSWELMKEILLCKANFTNVPNDRRVILYLNYCGCGRKYCQEKAAMRVQNQLKKVSLKEVAVGFTIEYEKLSVTDAGLVGHVHLNKGLLEDLDINIDVILRKCQEAISSYKKNKKVGRLLKLIKLSVSECCSSGEKWYAMPCVTFFLSDTGNASLDGLSHILADTVFPVLLQTIIKGDNRICTVNVNWVTPDTNMWIGDPCKTQKGELVVDIVLEKAVVKRSGDAWRVVLDSCLPILHLIDTRRSAPYAIKQVQELLGISCAFEQAVQRLSTSVTMVTKGVLKEHLILLGSSMTCSGKLLGFNPGGFKALVQSMNAQIPFTEATLYTPRRCFERAAEKCHNDSLSSIVASCSWGKHVAVGTGSRFEILWDTKEGVFNQDVVDVHNFLYMVRKTSIGGESSSACLGADIDDLFLDDENEWGMSPANDSTSKAVFEEVPELGNLAENDTSTKSTWDKISSVNADSTDGGDWFVDKCQSTSQANAWSGWGSNNAEANALPVKARADASETSDEWGGTKPVVESATTGSPAWGHNTNADGGGWNEGGKQSQLSHQRESSDWRGNDGQPEASLAWDSQKAGKRKETDPPWAQSKVSITEKNDFAKSNGWGTIDRVDNQLTWGPNSPDASDKWHAKNDGGSQWGKRKEANFESSGGCNTTMEESRWGQARTITGHEDHLGTSERWDTTTKGESHHDHLVISQEDNSKNSGGWNSTTENTQHGWGSTKGGGSTDGGSQWGPPIVSNVNKDHFGSSEGWGTPNDANQSAPSRGWSSSNAAGGNAGGSQSQWGEPYKNNRPENARGWGGPNAGDWKMKKNRPSRPPGAGNDDYGPHGLFTVTRQRIDMFTYEEQSMLADVEPLMQSIRRITRQSGYNDGDPLPADDQSYILENVFSYHPDKESKMGAGVDYVMICKHATFQDSRCFHIVSNDGRKEDFSTRKCLENFIMGKYPDGGAAFLEKYFRRPQPRGIREESPNLEAVAGAENKEQQ